MRELITSRKNTFITHYKKLGASRSYRHEQGEFLLDGKKLLGDALKCGYPVKSALLTDESMTLADGVRTVFTTCDVMQSVSPLDSPQGVMFSCPIPDCTLPELFEPGFYIALDAVRDPGNVGTVIRSADAFGIDGVILTSDCADPFNIKTARASMGGIFRMKIYMGGRDEIIKTLKRSDIPVFAACASEGAEDIRELDLLPGVYIIGNEGAGISEEMLISAGKRFKIPMNSACDSLNAAVSASVIMWELYRNKLG